MGPIRSLFSLQKEDIFSAEEARKMQLEADDRKKIQNRKSIFSSIQYWLDTTHKYTFIEASYMQNNQIYFEGLGYKVCEVWLDVCTGLEVSGPEARSQQPGTPYKINPIRYFKISWE